MRTIRLNISEQLLALFSEAIPDYSNKSRRFQTFRSTVQHACTRSRDNRIDVDDFQTFCAIERVEGTVQVWLQVSDRWKGEYDGFKAKLAEIQHFRANDSLTIAYVVHHALHHDLLGIAS